MGKIYKSLTKISNNNNQYNKITVIIKELDCKFDNLALAQLTNETISYEKNKLLLHYCILDRVSQFLTYVKFSQIKIRVYCNSYIIKKDQYLNLQNRYRRFNTAISKDKTTLR